MEVVLLVEDEDAVRRVIKAILQRSGQYRVLEACNGQEALDSYDRNKQDINLVLTDQVMPGMTGLDMARQLRSVYPDVKVICMSGYPLNISQLGFEFLAKPLLPDALLNKVREVLDA